MLKVVHVTAELSVFCVYFFAAIGFGLVDQITDVFHHEFATREGSTSNDAAAFVFEYFDEKAVLQLLLSGQLDVTQILLFDRLFGLAEATANWKIVCLLFRRVFLVIDEASWLGRCVLEPFKRSK